MMTVREIDGFLLVLAAILIALVIFGLIGSARWATWMETAPCSAFANQSLRNIPARCADYFARGGY